MLKMKFTSKWVEQEKCHEQAIQTEYKQKYKEKMYDLTFLKCWC